MAALQVLLPSPELSHRLAGVAELERRGTEGVPALCELVAEPPGDGGPSEADHEVQIEAIHALGRLADPRAVEALTQVAFFNQEVSASARYRHRQVRGWGWGLALQTAWSIAFWSIGRIGSRPSLLLSLETWLLLLAPTLLFVGLLLLAHYVAPFGTCVTESTRRRQEAATAALAQEVEGNRGLRLGWLASDLRAAAVDTLIVNPTGKTRRVYREAALRIDAIANLPVPATAPVGDEKSLPRPVGLGTSN